MTHHEVEILEYVTEEGKNVFRSWLHALKDKAARARIRQETLGTAKLLAKG